MKIKTMEIVLRIMCPECGKWNYVNKGEYTECSVENDFGVRCWFCSQQSWFCNDEVLNKEDIWFEEGKKKI